MISSDRTRSASRRAGTGALLLGIGFGGFFDGIVLHQILQWHHLLSSTGEHPVNTVAGLEANTLADGFFHAFTFIASLVGLFLLLSAIIEGSRVSRRRVAGLMLAGWGAFNLVEGLVDHQILTLHHVSSDNVVLWDTLFLIFGAALLLGGWLLARADPAASRTLSDS